MALTLDKPYLGLRIAATGGVPVFAPREGFCDGVVLNTPYVGLRAAALDGSPVFLISDQKVNADGTAIIGKPYIGLRASQVNGTLVYVVDGKVCEGGDDPMGCGDCSICCTLDGTLELGDGGTGYSAGVDFTLTCGGSFTASTYVSCLNDEIEDDTYCYEITTTYTGGSGFNIPYDFGGGVTGEYDWVTEVWVSDSFTAGGMTLRVWFVATQYTVRQATPTVSNFNQCTNSWGIQYFQEAVEFDCCADRWVNAYTFVHSGGVGFAGVKLNSSSDAPESPCNEGYSENGGGVCGAFNLCTTPGGMIAQQISTEDGLICDGSPFTILFEYMYCTASGGTCVSGDTSTYTKCFRLTIADNCE